MVRATVMDIEPIRGTDKKRVRGLIQFGYRETLNPRDVRLNRLDWIQLEPRSLNQLGAAGSPGGAAQANYIARFFAVPVGSLYLHGVVGSTTTSPPMQAHLGGAYDPNQSVGSSGLLLWIAGSIGTRIANINSKFPGTVAAGTRSAWFTVIGA